MAEKKTEIAEENADDKKVFVNWGTNVEEPQIDKEVQETLRKIEKQQVNGNNIDKPVITDTTKNTDGSEKTTTETPLPTPPAEKKTSESTVPEQKTPEQKESKPDTTTPATPATLEIPKTPETPIDKPAEKTTDPTETIDPNVLVIPETAIKKDSWTKLSKDQGFNIQNDDYDSYLKGYEEHMQQVAESAKAEIDEDIYKRISPSGQKMLEYELNGGNYFELQKTLNEYDKYLSLDNENIIREDYKSQLDVDGNRFYTNDRVEELINELSEDENKLREKANGVRVSVNNAKNDTERQMTDMQKNIASASDQETVNSYKAESEAISSVLAGKDEYMGKKITNDVRSYLQDQWDSGQVHKSLQDPKVMADFMIFSNFRDQIFKDNNRREYQKGAESVRKDLSNIPLDLGGGKRVEITENSESVFNAWKDVPVTV